MTWLYDAVQNVVHLWRGSSIPEGAKALCGRVKDFDCMPSYPGVGNPSKCQACLDNASK